MKYRMLAVDIDGTLFDSSGRAPECHIDAVQRARDAGVMVVLCTGRGLNEARPAVDQLQHAGPVVLANGSLVSDPSTGKTLHRMALEPHLALDIAEVLDSGQDAVLVLLDPEPTGLDYLIRRADLMTPNTRWWFSAIDAKLKEVDQLDVEDLHHALRLGIVGPPAHMPGVVGRLKERFGDQVFVQHFMAVKQDAEDVHVLEVFATGVNKWFGLQWLADLHGFDPQEVAAVGDEINDLQMIEGAGCGIAMGNAVPEVLAAADRVTAGHDEGGLAVAIDRMLAGEW
jgi:Cof subfamily protein (haloacid dehalogenase superfamily)